uniref:Twin-arginine translocation signal domain-containing protein n=1 Tax=Muribaculaceae bacterium Z82 TaxID=2304548 RepID=A0A7C9NS23_9BACT
MKLSRRTFLKLAGTAAGSVALTGLWGCASGAASSGASGGGGADASTKGPEGANANSSQNVGANAGDSAGATSVSQGTPSVSLIISACAAAKVC